MGSQDNTVDGGPPGQDREILREQAYADDSLLDVRRRTHELYTVDPVDFGRWTLEQMSWRGDERVLDVGCGPGDMLQAMARRHHDWGLLAGLDLSTGMVATAAGAAQGLGIQHFVGDGQALPLPGGSFDVVMARHMLYHVPDIDRALAQVARVLRPGGRFLATTNSRHTMAEYHALREQAAASFPAMAHSEMITDRFSLENGPSFLQPYFDQVEVHTLPGILRFPNTQPFVDYFESSRALTMRPGHTDAEWQAVLDFVRAEVEAVIRRRGHFDVTKLTGALVGIRRD